MVAPFSTVTLPKLAVTALTLMAEPSPVAVSVPETPLDPPLKIKPSFLLALRVKEPPFCTVMLLVPETTTVFVP